MRSPVLHHDIAVVDVLGQQQRVVAVTVSHRPRPRCLPAVPVAVVLQKRTLRHRVHRQRLPNVLVQSDAAADTRTRSGP